MEQILLNIGQNITETVSDRLARFIELSPFILGALAVFLFGWILAELTARSIVAMASKLKLEVISEKIGLKHFLKRTKTKQTPSEVIAKVVKGYLIFLFFIEATKVARLTKVADFLTEVINYVPDVMIAIFIMLVGIRIGNTMQVVISTSLDLAEAASHKMLGLAAKSIVITFAALAALNQLQIAPILVQIMFVGFISMLTIAGGLAFGLGGKDVVRELLQAVKRRELKEIKNSQKK